MDGQYFIANFTETGEYIIFGDVSNSPRHMDGLFIYQYRFFGSDTCYEISLQENTVNNALENIGWDRNTMGIRFRVDKNLEENEEEYEEDYESLDDILLRQPGWHPPLHFTIFNKYVTK